MGKALLDHFLPKSRTLQGQRSLAGHGERLIALVGLVISHAASIHPDRQKFK
jgi:hypothetical protein